MVVESRLPTAIVIILMWLHRGLVCWTLVAERAIDVIAGGIPVEL
jgi:hypothetical protein